MKSYPVQAYDGYDDRANDPSWELEEGVPLIHPSLEPAEWFTATQKPTLHCSTKVK